MNTPFNRNRAQTKSLGLLIILGLYPVLSLQPVSATPPAAPQNLRLASDNDNSPSKEWLDTPHGYELRQSRPRLLLNSKQLAGVIDRMYGPNAREPYATWFKLIKDREDSHGDVDLMNLAFLYKATANPAYKERYLRQLKGSTGLPRWELLFSVDIMWHEVDDQTKIGIMQRVANEAHPWAWGSVTTSQRKPPYDDVRWGYHSLWTVHALAYSGLFAYTDFENNKDPAQFPFDANNFIAIVKKELSDHGWFYRTERRWGGATEDNSALPGSLGGMYDNISYDQGGEQDSGIFAHLFRTLTNEDRLPGMLRDRHKGQFYQNMQYPYKWRLNTWEFEPGSPRAYYQLVTWNTGTTAVSQPNAYLAPFWAWAYQDQRVQYYANSGASRTRSTAPRYNNLFWNYVFYDDSVAEDPPQTNPTAMYFSGCGHSIMRTNWQEDAAFGVLLTGESSGRRYEDGNSFLMGRFADVVVHAGWRITSSPKNPINARHNWYTRRSISRNTIQIMDPNEHWDIQADGTTGPLHSGALITQERNFGGQIMSNVHGDANHGYGGSTFPLGLRERGNTIKFFHSSDNGYTYTVGDATAAYTKKIDLFQREFLFVRPDIFIIFDRVNSVDPSFKKIWSFHSNFEPIANGEPDQTSLGMKAYHNGRSATISNPGLWYEPDYSLGAPATPGKTYLDVLLPKNNKVVIRGGDTTLVENQPLSPLSDISLDKIAVPDLDTPRWLEVFAVGGDRAGTVRIHGDAYSLVGTGESFTWQEEPETSEDLVFVGGSDINLGYQSVVAGTATSIAAGMLTDNRRNWQNDQFKNFLLKINNIDYLITGNTENQLFGSFPVGGSGYRIFRPVANSSKYWKRIDRISTEDMQVDYLTVSVPHYFDTESADGSPYTFAPTTDGKEGFISLKRFNAGQWTFNLEAVDRNKLTNFLNVFFLKDSTEAKPQTTLIEAPGVSGVLIGSFFAVFSNDGSDVEDISLSLPLTGAAEGLFLNLKPNAEYIYKLNNNTLQISQSGSDGNKALSNAMGTLKLDILVE